jgi:hypothetical protein
VEILFVLNGRREIPADFIPPIGAAIKIEDSDIPGICESWAVKDVSYVTSISNGKIIRIKALVNLYMTTTQLTKTNAGTV